MAKNKILNKEIQKWLNGKRDYKEGVKLYYRYADSKEKVKVFPFQYPKENFNRLLYELERLVLIDPKAKNETASKDSGNE